MTGPKGGRAGASGPVLAGILAARSAENVLRYAFDTAQDRGAALRVVAAGLPPADRPGVADLLELWAAKYPDVPVTLLMRGGIDPAIAMTAATRGCGLAVLTRPDGARAAAVVRAVTRRASCPVAVA